MKRDAERNYLHKCIYLLANLGTIAAIEIVI